MVATVDGRNPATPKKPWNNVFFFFFCKYQLAMFIIIIIIIIIIMIIIIVIINILSWFQSGAKWIYLDFVHPQKF